MLPPEQLACIHIAFDSHRLVADAGLFSRMPLTHHPGLGGLVNRHVHPGDTPGRAHAGGKAADPGGVRAGPW